MFVLIFVCICCFRIWLLSVLFAWKPFLFIRLVWFCPCARDLLIGVYCGLGAYICGTVRVRCVWMCLRRDFKSTLCVCLSVCLLLSICICSLLVVHVSVLSFLLVTYLFFVCCLFAVTDSVVLHFLFVCLSVLLISHCLFVCLFVVCLFVCSVESHG